MTEFKQLELIYNQFLNLTTQINQLIEDEDYQTACLKTKDKDKLIKKMVLTKKTIDFTDEEKVRVDLIDKQISEENQKLIQALKITHQKIGEDLNKTKKKVKISSAYGMKSTKTRGGLIDTLE